MESEIRFYYSLNEYERLKEKLLNISSLNFAGRNYEKTSQYNHPMEKFDFYSKDIDVRFRVMQSCLYVIINGFKFRIY